MNGMESIKVLLDQTYSNEILVHFGIFSAGLAVTLSPYLF